GALGGARDFGVADHIDGDLRHQNRLQSLGRRRSAPAVDAVAKHNYRAPRLSCAELVARCQNERIVESGKHPDLDPSQRAKELISDARPILQELYAVIYFDQANPIIRIELVSQLLRGSPKVIQFCGDR